MRCLASEKSISGLKNVTKSVVPGGIILDNQGNIIVADSENCLIRKIEISSGNVSTVAGSTRGFLDGSASVAQFNNPTAVSVDTTGKIIYVADGNNYRIRVISNGTVATLITGIINPLGLFGPGVSEQLYVSEQNTHTILRVDSQ
jgi:DNA-binding beta-propeller fold protein YncE